MATATATATATGNWSNLAIWDIRVNGKSLEQIEQDSLMAQVNEVIDRAERQGKCKRRATGFVQWTDKNA